jgi:hypothetical protein
MCTPAVCACMFRQSYFVQAAVRNMILAFDADKVNRIDYALAAYGMFFID